MAILKIPTRRDIFQYRIEVVLEGEVYEFTFKYNRRSDVWNMDIGDTVLGIPMVGGINLVRPYQYHDTVPPGDLRIDDLDGLSRKAEAETFGDRIILVYDESA